MSWAKDVLVGTVKCPTQSDKVLMLAATYGVGNVICGLPVVYIVETYTGVIK